MKGRQGYLTAKRKQVIAITIILFFVSISLFVAGYVTTKTKQNLLTIVAILGCLPACKSLVSVIMYVKATGCSPLAEEKIKTVEGRLVGMYDMYFTSYKQNFALSHMVVDNKVILGYTESSKFDKKDCEEHLQTMLKQGGFKEMTVSISDNLDKYCEQLKKLNEKGQEADRKKEDEVRTLLYEITL